MKSTYFANLRDEAMALLFETRNYIKNLQIQNRGDTGALHLKVNGNCLALSLETMRLTSRLTQVIAWMLAQRAVSAGEITAEEGVSERFKLSGQSVCLEHNPKGSGHLPDQLRGLLKRSYELYLRVGRLEAQICGRLGMGEAVQVQIADDGASNILRLPPVIPLGQDPQNAY